MPLKMVMLRDRVIRTLSGHSVQFKKSEAVEVPDVAIAECLKYGAAPADGEELPEEGVPGIEDEVKIVDIPKTPGERKKRITQLFQEMRANAANHREHFTAAGRPRSNWVSNTLGFDVPAQEIEELWMALINPSEDD
jgi:hypothetical protein